MLLIPTYIDRSDIHGVGLFAKSDIQRGQIIWKQHISTTQTFWRSEFIHGLDGMGLDAIQEFLNFSYIRSGTIYYLNDNTRYINHCEKPNVAFQDDKTILALQDIKAGEEILENYFISYDKNDFFYKDYNVYQDREKLVEDLRNHIFKSGRPVKGLMF